MKHKLLKNASVCEYNIQRYGMYNETETTSFKINNECFSLFGYLSVEI